MKTLSILQPWAFAILNLGKDVENRMWATRFRGRFLIHTGRGFDSDGYDWLIAQGFTLPQQFERGGIVGSAVIRDCVQASASRWFLGPYGFVLQGVRSLPFIEYPGQRGWFDVPDSVIPAGAFRDQSDAKPHSPSPPS